MTPISVRSATTSLLAFSVLSQTVTGFLAVGPSTSRGTNNVAKKRPLTLTLKSSMANECPDFTGYHAPSVTPHSTTTAAGSSSSHPEEATTTSLSAVEATAAVLEDYYYVPDTAEQQPVFDLSESILAPSASSPATTNGFSLDHPSLSFARILVLAASAVYGTNFAMVKLLDEQMPLAISAAMRFSLAAVVTAFVILQGEDNNDENKADGALVGKERTLATWAGAEIGSWYCAGYLCQAMGLQTADASKVSTYELF